MSTSPSEHDITVTSEGPHKLNDTWVLWIHPETKDGVANHDWTMSGYEQLATCSTVEEFWEIFNDLPSLVHQDMWFFMREGVPPRWEDEVNSEGGSFKFRIHQSKCDNDWLTLALYLVGERMCHSTEDAALICGIALSPKKRGGFGTLSIWNLDCTRIGTAIFPSNIRGLDFKASRYEAHKSRHFG